MAVNIGLTPTFGVQPAALSPAASIPGECNAPFSASAALVAALILSACAGQPAPPAPLACKTVESVRPDLLARNPGAKVVADLEGADAALAMFKLSNGAAIDVDRVIIFYREGLTMVLVTMFRRGCQVGATLAPLWAVRGFIGGRPSRTVLDRPYHDVAHIAVTVY